MLLKLSILSLIIALIAACLGYGGLAVAATLAAKYFFLIFAIVLAIGTVYLLVAAYVAEPFDTEDDDPSFE